MSFALRNLSVLAYANGFTLWHYKSTDAAACAAPGFFDAAADMLASGDMLIVSSPSGARMLCVTATPGHVAALPLAA